MAARGMRQRGKEDESSISLLSTDSDFGPQRVRRQYSHSAYLLLAIVVGVVIVLVVALAVVLGIGFRDEASGDDFPRDPQQRALALLSKYPVIDGHNDMPWQIRVYFQNQLDKFNLSQNTSGADPNIYGDSWHTDIPRLRAGRVGAQFWSSWITCESKDSDATRVFIDQMDTIMRVIEEYPDTFTFATTAADIEKAAETGQIASLIGVEGGYAIHSSLAMLRQLYRLGARYMTLTHNCDLPWVHTHNSSTVGPKGLTDFGQRVVREMNRLGMMVDISHVSNQTMIDVLDATVAPVIFSHSSAFALCNHTRNVPDRVLQRVPQNGGIVMVNFFSYFVSCTPNATLEQVADHIDHIRSVAGIDYIGVGSDFDGIHFGAVWKDILDPCRVPVGLEDVSKIPALFAELIRRGYSDSDIKKIARLNLIRVFKAVEEVRDKLKGLKPDNTLISPQPNTSCRPNF